jgi:hypothetical protein
MDKFLKQVEQLDVRVEGDAIDALGQDEGVDADELIGGMEMYKERYSHWANFVGEL